MNTGIFLSQIENAFTYISDLPTVTIRINWDNINDNENYKM